MPKSKVTIEERIEAAKACAEGRISQTEAARRCLFFVLKLVDRFKGRKTDRFAFKAEKVLLCGEKLGKTGND